MSIPYFKSGITRRFDSESEYAIGLANYAIAVYRTGNKSLALQMLSDAEKHGYPNDAAARSMMME